MLAMRGEEWARVRGIYHAPHALALTMLPDACISPAPVASEDARPGIPRTESVMALPLALLATIVLLQQQGPPIRFPAASPLPAADPAAPLIEPNDNRHAGGTLEGSTLRLTLEVRKARFRPDGEGGVEVPTLAFAEPGKAPQVPGPMIRARVGTTLVLTLRNLADSALVVGGLGVHADPSRDTVQLPKGATREVRTRLARAGTRGYWAAFAGTGFMDRLWYDSQLSGAIVVDAAGARTDDRILVITEWFLDGPKRNEPFWSALMINGLGWPNTERFRLTEGDSVRWRVINHTGIDHPMHLHGFFFRVARKGDLAADSAIAPSRQKLVVTELMHPGESMSMAFLPTQPGNWVFHCHFAGHVGDHASLTQSEQHRVHAATPASANGAPAGVVGGHQMHGLVIGMHVAPRPDRVAGDTGRRRDIRLLAQKREGYWLSGPAYGFALHAAGTAEPSPDVLGVPGPILELRRGEPVRINVVNRLEEPTGVHWHGIELESHADGVPNWSGVPGNVMAPIAPGDSFPAMFTPPRSGTYIYHSHLHENAQINGGMYGALIITDKPRDPARDHIYVIGGGGQPLAEHTSNTFGRVNGRMDPPPLRVKVGETHRLRFVSIHPNWDVRITMLGDEALAHWVPVAKDGADVPATLRTPVAASIRMGPGETADMEFTAPRPGRWRLEFRTSFGGWYVPVNVEASR
jgi:FtsP/CotA-like multicopper oxidase with cupredoxin domain